MPDRVQSRSGRIYRNYVFSGVFVKKKKLDTVSQCRFLGGNMEFGMRHLSCYRNNWVATETLNRPPTHLSSRLSVQCLVSANMTFSRVQCGNPVTHLPPNIHRPPPPLTKPPKPLSPQPISPVPLFCSPMPLVCVCVSLY